MTIVLNGTTGITTPKLDAVDLELGSVNVVERDSNANGEYVRFADGTQICRITEALSDAAGDVTLTFPAAFYSAPTTAISRQGVSTSVIFFSIGETTAVGCKVGGYNTAFARSAGTYSTIAIGRWF